MHLVSDAPLEYGEEVTLIAHLPADDGWLLLPAVVRWFSGRSVGVAFRHLEVVQRRALEQFVTVQPT
jgi:hypothetical protein